MCSNYQTSSYMDIVKVCALMAGISLVSLAPFSEYIKTAFYMVSIGYVLWKWNRERKQPPSKQ